MQYTVFYTKRLRDPWDGTFAGRITRTKSFLDKRKANKHAESLLPKSRSIVARMELDYGFESSGRDGMFYSRVQYTDGTFVYIYVDREEQEYGSVNLDELHGKSVNLHYEQLRLSPRYDVFVFLRKKIDKNDGTFVIYKFDETPKIPAMEFEEDDDSDDGLKNGEKPGGDVGGSGDQVEDIEAHEDNDPADADLFGSPKDNIQDVEDQDEAQCSLSPSVEEQLEHTITERIQGKEDGDSDVDFHSKPLFQVKWFDPNSVKENNVTACTCSYTWKWDGQTTIRGDNNSFDAVDFVVCTNQYPSVFEMRVNNFMGPSNLTLFMSHFYKDSTLWGAPYLYAQTWAMPNLSLSLQDSSDLYRNYTNVGPILANITGLQG
ncbi:hypothetical protein SBRCBS47491_003561 [Sporothrix bragantina]|uniref:Uncharacterized protein n=1 Tax=Sporothrix bragantina TaxID=671064 RepID=A0ABP0BG89_9PEZI